MKNIIELRTELDDKEKFLILCQNRLENRAQRPGTELCKDRVQDSLLMEMQTLQHTIQHLKHMIDQVYLFIFEMYAENAQMKRKNFSFSVDDHTKAFITYESTTR